MSVLSANKKYLSLAATEANAAENLGVEQADIDLRRNILSNIRRQRLAESQVSFINQQDDFTSSSDIHAKDFVNTSFAEPLGYTLDYMDRRDEMTEHYNKAQSYIDKYEGQAKKAAQIGAVSGLLMPGVGSLAWGTVLGGDRNFIRGNIEGQKAGLEVGAKTISGAATGFAVGNIPGAIVGGVAGFASGVGGAINKVSTMTGQNNKWARAQNELNWSTSKYYGTAYNPVRPRSNIRPLNIDSRDMANIGYAWGLTRPKDMQAVEQFSEGGVDYNGDSWGQTSTFRVSEGYL